MGDNRPMSDLANGLDALSVAFGSLGRAVLCLGRDFRVVRVSDNVEQMFDSPIPEWTGLNASQVLGDGLFGPSGEIRAALEAGTKREGWRAYLTNPSGDAHLVSISAAPLRAPGGRHYDSEVAYLVVARPAIEEHSTGASGPSSMAGMVARSSAMERIFELIVSLRHSDATVLVTGESGTGKEVVARAIHKNSPRSSGPFVAVNCGALPGDLLESELFGHVRGAFTGAIRDRAGRFELARDGTLFLDEVGDIPLHLQVKLLRVLQERAFERVGESRTRTTDARILAATNIDLKRAVVDGRFREDLYYRLRVVPIEIPPLRVRPEDIEPLAQTLLARTCRRRGRSLELSPATIRRFLLYDWPGNVRELENALEYAVAVCPGQTILPEHLPPELSERSDSDRASGSAMAQTESAEAVKLRQVLEAHQWNRTAAAKSLGISRTTLWRRMREQGLAGHATG